jgi:TRAP-type uncharacterized transport system fused permease subunit
MSETTAEAETSSNGNADDLVAAADTGARNPAGITGQFLFIVAVAWSLFQLWYASPLPFTFNFPDLQRHQARAIHLAFALFLAYTAFPGIIRRTAPRRSFPPSTCWPPAGLLFHAFNVWTTGSEARWIIFAVMGALLAAAYAPGARRRSTGCPGGLAAGDRRLAERRLSLHFLLRSRRAARPPTLFDLVVAGAGLVLLLEATRRALGPALMIICDHLPRLHLRRALHARSHRPPRRLSPAPCRSNG